MAEIGTKTIDLGGGDSAVILQELTHGTSRKVQAITRVFLKAPDAKLEIKEDKGKTEAKVTSQEVAVDWENADFTKADDALILGQTAKWSFGEVTQEVLDTLAETKRDALLKAVDEECDARPLPESGEES